MESAPRFGKKEMFAVGLGAGILVAANWHALVKGTIKIGLKGAARLQRVALKSAESLSDVTHEARTELFGDTPQG